MSDPQDPSPISKRSGAFMLVSGIAISAAYLCFGPHIVRFDPRGKGFAIGVGLAVIGVYTVLGGRLPQLRGQGDRPVRKSDLGLVLVLVVSIVLLLLGYPLVHR